MSEPVFEVTEHWVVATFKRLNADATLQVGSSLNCSVLPVWEDNRRTDAGGWQETTP